MPAPLGDIASRAGQAMLVAALLLVLVGLLVTLPRLLRVRRQVVGLRVRVEAARAEVLGELEEFEHRKQEADQLMRPIRRLRKWLRHPLSVAAFQSYRRRGRRGTA
jgi:hypothetical protein